MTKKVAFILLLISSSVNAKVLYYSEPGALPEVLAQLAEQHELQIFFKSRLLRGYQTPALEADSLPDLLNALLKETGLHINWLDEKSLVIRESLAPQIVTPVPPKKVELLPEQPEVIEVRGVRSSLQHSLLRKRHASQIIDVITAEDIGKLPDTTITDSLQRVTGIQITRSAGEGSKLNVRGMPQVTTTLNGEQMVSAGSINVLQPDYMDVPSALVSSLDVIKTPQASQLHTGISGTIDIHTWRPFNLKEGLSLHSTFEKNTGSMSEDSGHQANLFVGYNSEHFGLVLNGYNNRVNLANYSLGSTGNSGSYWWKVASEHEGFYDSHSPSGSTDYSGDGDSNDSLLAAQGHVASNRFVERERSGLSSSFEVGFTPQLKLILDLFYTQMHQNRREANFIASQSWTPIWGWYLPEDPVVVADTYQEGEEVFYMEKGTLQATSINAQSRAEVTANDTLNTNLELSYSTARATTQFRLIHGRAESSFENSVIDGWLGDGSARNSLYRTPSGNTLVNPNGYQGLTPVNLQGDPIESEYKVYPLGIDYTGEFPHWQLPDLDDEPFGEDPSRYGFVSTYSSRNYHDTARLTALRNDTEIDFYGEHLHSFKIGMRYGKRTTTRDYYDYLAPFTSSEGNTMYARWKDAKLVFPDTGYSYVPQMSFDQLPADWLIQVNDFGPATGIPPIWFVDPKLMDDAIGFQESLFPGHIKSFYANESYKVKHQKLSAYLQADFEGELPWQNLSYSANLGVQFVSNTNLITQYIEGLSTDPLSYNGELYVRGPGATANSIGELLYENSHQVWLPSFNLALYPSDDHIVRFSWSKKQTEQDAENLGRGLAITRIQDKEDPNLFKASSAKRRGNPELEPWLSDNLDLTWEWYFNPTGLLSFGAFYINVASFIENSSYFATNIPDSDGVVRKKQLPVSTIDNGKDGVLKGVEITWQNSLAFIAPQFDSFGFLFNYTWALSDSARKDYYGKPLPVPDNSEHQANSILWYDNGKLQTRLALNYRSKKFISQIAPWDKGTRLQRSLAHWQAPTLYVDLSMSYQLTPQLKLFFTGNNLTEEYQSTYLQWPTLTYSQQITEARFAIGFNLALD